MYCASTQARTALTYGKEHLQDGTWELEDDEEEAWESGGNGWDVSPTFKFAAGARVATACL